jgi:hypothetical protein
MDILKRLTRTTLLLIVSAGFLPGIINPEASFSAVSLEADATARVHGINASDTLGQLNNDAGAANPLLNVQVLGVFDQGIEGYGELYIGQAHTDDETVDIGSFYGSTGNYFSFYEIKFGQLEMPFGTQPNYRSDHGQVQNNPLIGNPLVEPTDHQLGTEISGQYRNVDWAFALSNGTESSSLNPDRGFGSALRLSIKPSSIITVTASGYRSQHSDTSANRGVNEITTENLFGPGEENELASLTSLQQFENSPYPFLNRGLETQPNVLTAGRDLIAWQTDLQIDYAGTWRARYGSIEDDLSNLGYNFTGNERLIEWDYFSLEGKHPLPLPLYLAWRWDELNGESLKDVPKLGQGILRNGSVERYQIGLGRQVGNNLRIKLEYVSSEENLTSDQLSYDGISFEVSLTGIPKLSSKNLEKNVALSTGNVRSSNTASR